MAHRLTILQPSPGIFAYYEGREIDHRFSTDPNWVDEGALELGIASYAVLSDKEALVYDTHVAIDRARAIRAHLEAKGAQRITVVLSHHHLDHVAGTEVFADCEIISNEKTLAHLVRGKTDIESGINPPAINPLILPTRTFNGSLDLQVGQISVRLIEANVHSDDATVLWLSESRILIAGDTVEDLVTYVDEPRDLAIHHRELDRLKALEPVRILPCHGDRDVIARGGYDKALIVATQRYIAWLMSDPDPKVSLHDLFAKELASGVLNWFAPYEALHRQNVERALIAADRAAQP